MWWQSDALREHPILTQFDQTPSAVVWLAFWVWLGATVGFVIGAIIAKCVSGRSDTRKG
jgi:hypothetical protein